MSVQVVNGVQVISDRCAHRASSVGQGGWVVSYLPGRTLTLPQAVAALQFAEFAHGAYIFARTFGLTTREAVHFALAEPTPAAQDLHRERQAQ